MSTLSLMYHEVYPANASEYLSTTGPEFSAKRLYAVSDLAFASHLRMLRVSGMSFVLATADSMLASGASRQVILTFDDGGISAWDFTVPLLNLHAAKAHFFVCGDFVGKKGFLTRTHLLEMARQGHVIGSHGLSHCPLTGLSDLDLDHELKGSKQFLEELLNAPCDIFCIPGGHVDARVWRRIKGAGYRLVCTSSPPIPILARSGLCRWAVREHWGEPELHALINGKISFTFPIIFRYYGLELLKQAVGLDRYLAARKRVLEAIRTRPS